MSLIRIWSSTLQESVSREPDLSIPELDHQRSAANTSVNKMGLDTFVFNLFNYCRLVSYFEFAFHGFNYF